MLFDGFVGQIELQSIGSNRGTVGLDHKLNAPWLFLV